jgi:hypothetical protein
MTRPRSSAAALALAAVLGASQTLLAQTSSSTLAADLVRQLDARKLDSIAAAAGDGEWVAALHLAGSELLVVQGRAGADLGLQAMAARRAYRDIYIALHSGVEPGTKVLISDVGANGLKPTRQGSEPPDTVERGERRRSLDGNWARVGQSEADYMSAYRTDEAQYIRMLQALLAEVGRP